ncbi:organic cation transporter protein isoform X2 [Agrilus planipennis]|uniref:Organic cation transporter protein isoform X2 n=1 Tax=Agrilus planipennis TaxID=224129 RepID=A0A1W4WYZ1_AGRPL|nr:organic cation transporter protein isoform X2 [Agrilus planipennis]
MDAKKTHSNDFIEKSIGTWGKWQLLIVIAVFLVKFPIAFHQLNIVFLAPSVSFMCNDNSNSTCSKNCSGYIYDRSLFSETIITQWNLVCEKSQLANFAQTVTMLGILIGNMVFGVISDKWGRKAPLVWAVVIQVASGTLCALAPWFWLFLLLRLICATATGGTMITSFVIVMEVIGSKYRTTVGILYQIPFNLGHVTLALVGYYFRNWRHFQLIISVPPAILILYYWILPESPRWLLAMGKTKEVVQVLEKAAKFNNLPLGKIKENVEEAARNTTVSSKKKAGNVFHLFKTPVMRKRTLCISFNWISCGFCFYGVAQYMGRLAGNIFINVALSGAVQIPGTICTVWFIQILGRRNTLLIADLIAGISIFLIVVVPPDYSWATTLLGCNSMFWLVMCFGTLYVYSGELFPTTLRNAGIGFASLTARFGSMVSPFIMGLSSTSKWIPPTLFGVVPLIGACLCFFLPETKNLPLPDTVAEAEILAKGQNKGGIEMTNTTTGC